VFRASFVMGVTIGIAMEFQFGRRRVGGLPQIAPAVLASDSLVGPVTVICDAHHTLLFGVLTQVKSLSLAEPPFRYTRTRRCIGKAGYSRDCGMYAQQGSSARGSPVSAKARAREPPQTFRNSQHPHLPFNCELSRRDKNKGEFW